MSMTPYTMFVYYVRQKNIAYLGIARRQKGGEENLLVIKVCNL